MYEYKWDKYLFITGESHKYEETLQCVEANKDIPDRREVNEAGGQTGDPCQTHNDSQSMKKGIKFHKLKLILFSRSRLLTVRQ